MKVVLYMAITANGMIAKENDDTRFVSDAEWESFTAMMKKIGNYVMGRRTFEVSLESDAFPYPCLNVVMTKKAVKNQWGDQVIFTSDSPKAVLKMLEERGFDTAFIGGGAAVNTSFAREGLIDEVYLDVEPAIMGKGIPLLASGDFELKLKLLETKKLGQSTIQLHYQVIKQPS